MPRLFQARVVLSDLAIKNLPLNPVLIIPAPGLDKQVVLVNGFAHRTFIAPYTNITNPAYIVLAHPANPASPVITNDVPIGTYLVNAGTATNLSDFMALASVDDTQAILLFPSGKSDPLGLLSPNIGAVSAVRNKGIRLNCNNNSVAFIGGNRANQIYVTLSYMIYDYSSHLYDE